MFDLSQSTSEVQSDQDYTVPLDGNAGDPRGEGMDNADEVDVLDPPSETDAVHPRSRERASSKDTSLVWTFFVAVPSEDKVRCQAIYASGRSCGIIMSYKVQHGTQNMRRHLK